MDVTDLILDKVVVLETCAGLGFDAWIKIVQEIHALLADNADASSACSDLARQLLSCATAILALTSKIAPERPDSSTVRKVRRASCYATAV